MLPLIPFDLRSDFPRKIHQVYFGGQLPEEVQSNIRQIRARNPEYSYQLWSEQEVVEFIRGTYGPEILERYNRIAPAYLAARADLVRYLVLYALGGVYLDVKSNLLLPLEEVIPSSTSCFLSHWDNLPGNEHEGWIPIHKGLEHQTRGEYVQWVLVYRAGHPMLREIIIEVLQCIDTYNPFVNSVGRGGVLSTTGPIPYNRAISRVADIYKDYYAIRELPELGFVYSIYHSQGAESGHKQKLPSNYWTLSSPIVRSDNSFIQGVSTLFLKVYYFILDNVIYKLQGRGR